MFNSHMNLVSVILDSIGTAGISNKAELVSR